MVIVVPDGTVNGSPSLTSAGSFWINSKAGNFGDYLVRDVWHWALANFAVRPEREAHVVAGASMGGFGAYNVAFKNKSEFAHVVGIMPPINMRYGDCDGRYLSDYDPSCFKLRFVGRRNEVVGVFYGGLLIRSRRLLDPLVGADAAPEEANAFVSRENPYEMLRRYGVRPGEFNLFVGYGKRDEFNIDAQAESFVDECARLGIFPTTLVLPRGRHNVATALDMIPALNQWTFEKVGPLRAGGLRAAGPGTCSCGRWWPRATCGASNWAGGRRSPRSRRRAPTPDPPHDYAAEEPRRCPKSNSPAFAPRRGS